MVEAFASTVGEQAETKREGESAVLLAAVASDATAQRVVGFYRYCVAFNILIKSSAM